MTQPQDPRKQPLQDDEIALARVLRALPSGEPSARVDDAILRAATDAASPGRRKPARRLPWLPTWAIGTAAAAVLAVGIGTQLRPPLAPETSPASMSEAVKPMPQARERLSVDLIEPDPSRAPPPASAPPAPRQSTRSAPPPPPRHVQPAPPPAPPAPAAEPQAFPNTASIAPAASAPSLGAANEAAPVAELAPQREDRLRSEATDQARRVHQEAYARRAQAKASAEGEVDARAEAGVAAPAAAQDAMQAADAAAPQAAILPPAADDTGLGVDAWIERIRERLRQGDRAGARASLGLFMQAHPEASVPSDLDRLR
ncbi:MAG: hypothetical protein K0M70_15305 [Arenimonas sp.]|uniref:hypothetical protein n=1 Tax=Arenimonas sp. TaxID=1872635 RepID=UPI0025C14B82|nr:hypothetical protein [Arenimonas sp.]MBW8369211.1 hypothetical protein [Arenimonas sp.]